MVQELDRSLCNLLPCWRLPLMLEGFCLALPQELAGWCLQWIAAWDSRCWLKRLRARPDWYLPLDKGTTLSSLPLGCLLPALNLALVSVS